MAHRIQYRRLIDILTIAAMALTLLFGLSDLIAAPQVPVQVRAVVDKLEEAHIILQNGGPTMPCALTPANIARGDCPQLHISNNNNSPLDFTVAPVSKRAPSGKFGRGVSRSAVSKFKVENRDTSPVTLRMALTRNRLETGDYLYSVTVPPSTKLDAKLAKAVAPLWWACDCFVSLE